MPGDDTYGPSRMRSRGPVLALGTRPGSGTHPEAGFWIQIGKQKPRRIGAAFRPGLIAEARPACPAS